MSSDREFDIIVWGASGFTGRLVAEYLFNNYSANGTLKWAMGGRSEAKLEQVRAEVADSSIPLVVADSHDKASLAAMVQRTHVICTTVGPYSKYGSKLVAACVANQTHYCDLTGEVTWMRHVIDRHHETAAADGTKIVTCCGFDSIPSDMGVYFIQKEAIVQTGYPAKQIKMRVRGFSGGFSGGTYASLNDMMAQAQQDRSLFKILIEPYSLNPAGEQSGPDTRDLQRVIYDDAINSWIFPFIMAGINTKIVRRSNALGGYPYGREFRYDEAVMSGDGFQGRMKGLAAAVPLGIMMTLKPGSLLKKGVDRLMPKPGEGPTRQQREAGFYDLRFIATLADGSSAVGRLTGDMDPGYGSTSKMIAECAICLVKDEIPDTAGVLTPSIAMGDALLKRLQENAGLTFTYRAGTYSR
ncbi:MAG: saccharopine dehydrogenase NADP-binding domain-containing protein [Chloroflexota bacterium]